MRVYYNEIDEYCCNWLSNLMDRGAITPGVIDNRSVEDIAPDDLVGFDRVHFFAGIGVWEYAFIQSGLDAYSGIWTGSCPCQPFSAAGKGDGFADERHLWPAFFHLIQKHNPTAVLGEQVASKDGLAWLDLVSADMEGTDYAFGAGDLCAAGFGAPHIRQRTYWSAFGVEHSSTDGLQGRVSWRKNPQWSSVNGSARRDRAVGHVADVERFGREVAVLDSGSSRAATREREAIFAGVHRPDGAGRRIPDAFDGAEQSGEPRSIERFISESDGAVFAGSSAPAPTNGFWSLADWLYCRDDKWRPVEPGTFPLVNGASSRVGRLRAYGNAIVAPQAIEFCRTVRQFIETINSDI